MAIPDQRRARAFRLPTQPQGVTAKLPRKEKLQEEAHEAPPADATVKLSTQGQDIVSDELFPVLRVVAGADMFAYVVLDEGDEIIVGRDDGADLVLHDSSVSRRHASFSMKGDEHCVVTDLGSTNGVSVAGRLVRRRRLVPGAKVMVGSIALRYEVLGLHEYKHLRRVNRKLSQASGKDPLTNLLMRGYLDDDLPGLVEGCERHGYDFTVAFIDLDHFKSINDTFGHAVGDAVLAQVARIGLGNIRETDVLVRYGGEELVLFMPNTDEWGATVATERLRRAISNHDWAKTHEDLKVSASFGVAQREPCEPIEAMLERADQAMYQAKRAGRDRIVLASELEGQGS